MNRRLVSAVVLLFASALPLPAQEFKPVEVPASLPRDGWAVTAICPRGKLIAVSGNEGLRVWEFATGRKVADLGVFRDGIHTMTFSPDAALLAVGVRNEGTRIWDVAAGRWKYQWKNHNASALAFSQDGTTLGSASSTEAKLWDLRAGKEVTSIAWQVPWWVAVFSRDLKTLVITDHNDVVVWDVPAKNERLLEGHRGVVMAVAFGPGDKTLYSASLRTRRDEAVVSEIRAWDVASGKQVAAWQSPLPALRSLAVSPDGKFLAVVGSDPDEFDSTLRLVETATGRVVPDLELTGQWLMPCFGPGGSWVVGSVNHQPRMWEVVPPKK